MEENIKIEIALELAVKYGVNCELTPEQCKWVLEENKKLKARIAELENAQRWTPVAEPPKIQNWYLTLDDENDCFISFWKGWFENYTPVTHWMPLPESPIVYGKESK